MSLQTKPFERVYMLFALGKDWRVSFLANDLTTSPLNTLSFADRKRSENWRSAVKRWGRPRHGHCSNTRLGGAEEESTFN
jgi:hypothetical protein